MRPKKKSDEPVKKLRDEAEEKLALTPDQSPVMPGKPLVEIIQELRVHQIELELQNEELKKAYLDLEISRDRYLDLYDFTPVGYVSLTRNALIAEVNLTGAAMLGIVRHDLIQDRFRRFVSPKEHNDWDHFFLTILQQGEKQTGDLLLKRSDGTYFPARIEGIRTITAAGSYQVRLAISDVTDRKRAEEALVEVNKKLTLLSGLTRHDIINHITAMSLTLDILNEESDIGKIHKRLPSAREICKKMETTIGFTKDYDSFGTISSGWQPTHPTIDSAISEVMYEGVLIENQIPRGIEIYAEPILRKVFVTLLDNAIRHGGKISKIEFSSEEQDGSLIISCVDDGIGIPVSEKDYVFDHGYGKHTGIGLFLAREILSITGLSIREVGVPGKGARFEIIVPAGKFRRVA